MRLDEVPVYILFYIYDAIEAMPLSYMVISFINSKQTDRFMLCLLPNASYAWSFAQ